MPVNSLTFGGVSKFASDFQNILTRSVKIQSLPLQSLQQGDAVVLSKRSALSSIENAVAALSSSLTSLGTLAANRALSANSSDTSKVQATYTGATTPGVYTINQITSLATAATETSVKGYADSTATAVSSTGTLQLTVGSTNYPIQLASGKNNLAGLQQAINASGAPVTASILTTGTGANPNFLSVSANVPGATALVLTDDPSGAKTALLTAANQGSNAVFKLNGVDVSQPSNVVNSVVGGISFTLLATSSAPVNITLSSYRPTLATGLSAFANAYNSLRDQLSAQTGAAGGVLAGDSVLNQIQAALRQLATPTAGGLQLSDLGLAFQQDGKLSFDPSAVNNLTDSQLGDAFAFLGSTTQGPGALAATFRQLSDPVSGSVKAELDSFDASDTRYQTQITTLTDRINTYQQALFTKLSKADSEIASLASTQNLLTASIQGLDYTLYGRNVNTSA